MTNTTDSDIPTPRTPTTEPSEIRRIWEIRTKQAHEHPRYWNGADFSTKAEEAKQFDNRDDAVLEMSGLKAGAYLLEVGL